MAVRFSPQRREARRAFETSSTEGDGQVPGVIASAASGLDALSVHFGDGGRRRGALGLTQEVLNAEFRFLQGRRSDATVPLRLGEDAC